MIPPAERQLWFWHFGALIVYAALSLLLLDHGQSLFNKIQGVGVDPLQFIWFLAWWPWAIGHHLNPLHAALVWQPLGIYLGWVTSVPLLSLIGLPITLLWGPVASFNILILAAPVLSAWAAYYLCLKVTGVPAAAMIGGYLFGFSSYEMAQSLATLNLSFTMFVPLLLLVVLMRLDDQLTRAKAVLSAAVILSCQFLVSIEIFAMVFVFGGIAWLFAMLYLPRRRPALRRLFVDAVIAAPFVIVPLSPFLFSMFSHVHAVHLPAAWPYFFTADFLNIFVPTKATALGGALLAGISGNFKGGIQEQDAYLGMPLLLIVFFYTRDHRRMPAGRWLAAIFLSLLILSLGPRLWVNGHVTRIALPWLAFVQVPLLSSALPARFALFVSLVAAVIAAKFLAGIPPHQRGWPRLALSVLACMTLLPRLHPWMNIPYSKFFGSRQVSAALGKNPKILVLPFAINGASSFWQVESGFSFSQTGGYLAFPPAAMQRFPAVGELFGNFQNRGFLADVGEFCAATGTQYIVAGPGTPAALWASLGRLHWAARTIDDVTIFTVPGAMAKMAHG